MLLCIDQNEWNEESINCRLKLRENVALEEMKNKNKIEMGKVRQAIEFLCLDDLAQSIRICSLLVHLYARFHLIDVSMLGQK